MMTKKCTCEGEKVDPNCPVCSKKVDYLKDFHRLNPEAKPPRKKMAGLFSAPAKGFFGGMDPATKMRLLEGARNTAIPALAAGLPAAVLAGATSDKGEGTGDALRAGLLAGGTAAAAHFGHGALMGGKSPWAHSYQRGVGTDIRNIANKGREAMGMPTVALPRPPKVASVDNFKLADPYQDYGQYGREPQDNGPGLGTMLALGGMGALGARALHGGLMASRGNFARGYQANLGNAIRAATNSARTGMGMSTVPLAPTGLNAKIQDLAHNVSEFAGNAHEAVKPAINIGKNVAGGATAAYGAHKGLMTAGHRVGNAYKKYVGAPAEGALGSAADRLKQWWNRPSASARVTAPPPKAAPAKAPPAKEPAAKASPPKVPSGEDTKVEKIGPGVTKRPTTKKASLNDFLLSAR